MVRSRAWPYGLIVAGLALTWAMTLAPPIIPTLGRATVPIAGREVSRDAAYLFAWAAALTVAGLVNIVALRARGALSPSTFAGLLLSGAAFVVGAKLQYLLEGLPWRVALRFLPELLFADGMRLPLGLLLSGVAACGVALAARASWRAVGDAWAVGASLMIPVGRAGCLLVGCCMGAPCGAWAPTFLCRSYPPGSEVFVDQLSRALVTVSSPSSLPVHLLPLYFAAASLGTLAVLLALWQRDAPPGALLAAFCILRPLAKLALEPLRAEPRPGVLMTALPAAVLSLTALVLVVAWVRQRARTRPLAVHAA